MNAADDGREAPGGLAQPILSVTELCEAVVIQLGASSLLQSVTVRGEVVEPRAVRGHVYFTLRDATSLFECIRWGSVIGEPVVHGRTYDVTGKVELYGARGQIRFIASRVRGVDAGQRHLALEQLTERLRLEGIFDSSRKLPIPRWPSRIGVATSAEGAVIHDLRTVIGKRMPLTELVLASCAVQGVGAAGGIVSAVWALARARVNVIVVARGGGSADDLAAFNEEVVARAVRQVSEETGIPVVSAVGHETDTTLCDHASDLRAPTPSAAGEMLVPDAAAVRGAVQTLESRASNAVMRRIDAHGKTMAAMDRRLELASRAIGGRLQTRLESLDKTLRALVPARLDAMAEKVSDLDARARAATELRVARVGDRLKSADVAIELLSPLRVLERGYAIIERNGVDGQTRRAIASVGDLQTGERVRLRLRDGVAGATISTVTPTTETAAWDRVQ